MDAQIMRQENGGFGQQENQLIKKTEAGEAAVSTSSTRAAEEVRAAMVVARQFPRDEAASYNRIMQSCRRQKLAENAVYSYPKGGSRVEGPSIRLAEMLAQNWGNIDFGVVELEQRHGESTVMTYAWDLETNTRQTKVFTVKHARKARGQVKSLTDPREIYEMTANQGARRLRACILGVIPGDVIDSAVEACTATLHSAGGDKPLADRVRSMVVAFTDMGVTQDEIEARLNHKLDATTEHELVELRKIFTSLRDNMSSKADWFGNLPKKVEAPAPPPPAAPAPPAQSETVAAPDPTRDTSLIGNLREWLSSTGVPEPRVIEFCGEKGMLQGAQSRLEDLTDAALGQILANRDQFGEAFDAWMSEKGDG